jgi:hypothetical protein
MSLILTSNRTPGATTVEPFVNVTMTFPVATKVGDGVGRVGPVFTAQGVPPQSPT